MVFRPSLRIPGSASRFWAFGAASVLGGGALAHYAYSRSAFADAEQPVKPNVYLWGDNSQGLIASGPLAPSAVRVPTKVAFLENQTLRSLAVCPSYALAAVRNGDVLQWTSPDKGSIVLKSKNISKLLISPRSHVALALAQDGSLWTWEQSSTPKKVSTKLGWFEKIVNVECGVDHLLALTNKGRVFSASLRAADEHHGQLGIAAYPYFEPLPEPGQLHHVKLLESSVTQIACGAFHSLFLVASGDLFGCGSNQYGQLMLPYTYRNTKISVPTKLPTGVSPSGIASVAAGSYVTYFKSAAGSSAPGSWFVAGDGEYGQFGTGSYSQCQVSPLRLAPLDTMREYDETMRRVVPVSVAADGWRIGETHVFASVDNAARDWLVWGSNERGQIGNNKLAKISKPTPAPGLVVGHATLGATAFVAGDRISGCYQACSK